MSQKSNLSFKLTMVLLMILCNEIKGKLTENDPIDSVSDMKTSKKINEGAVLLFADELKQTLERYLFGICPQNYKMPFSGRGKNFTASACDLDTEQQDLAGRLATLALRVHSAIRGDCTRLGTALANTLGELARTAANRHAFNVAAANEANKKRKMSKSQKAKLQAKQRTALAVKKKAAAAAAAAAGPKSPAS